MGNVLLLGRNTGPLGNFGSPKKWFPGYYGHANAIVGRFFNNGGNCPSGYPNCNGFYNMPAIQPFVTYAPFPGVAGLSVGMTWGVLEGSTGSGNTAASGGYNFNTAVNGNALVYNGGLNGVPSNQLPDLDNCLAQATAAGLKFSLLIYLGGGWGSDKGVPNYIMQNSTYGAADAGSSGLNPSGLNGVVAAAAGGQVANYNNASVFARIVALFNALGAYLDGNPNVACVRLYTTDTLLGYNGTQLDENHDTAGYTGCQAMMEALQASFPTTPVALQVGYGTINMATLVTNLVQQYIMVGCSDTVGGSAFPANAAALSNVCSGGTGTWASPPSGTSATLSGGQTFTGFGDNDYQSGSYPIPMILPATGAVTATFTKGSGVVTFSKSVSETVTTGTTIAAAPYMLPPGSQGYLGLGGAWNNNWTPPTPALTTYIGFAPDIEPEELTNVSPLGYKNPSGTEVSGWTMSDFCTGMNDYGSSFVFPWMCGPSGSAIGNSDLGVASADWITASNTIGPVPTAIAANPLINTDYPYG